MTKVATADDQELAGEIETARHPFRRKKIVVAIIVIILQVGIATLYLIPFYWMILESFSTNIFGLLNFAPAFKTFNNYYCVWTFGKQPVPKVCSFGTTNSNFYTVASPLFPQWYFNSVVIALSITAASVFFGALSGYALSRLRFPGQRAVFYLVIISLMIPFPVITLTEYLLLVRIGLLDTYQGVIIPAIASALVIFLMRQNFMTLPTEVEESAKIDGLKPYQIFFRIALPLSKPALSAGVILSFIGAWNSFIWPLYALPSTTMFTLPLATAFFKGVNGTQIVWTQMAAFDALSMLPVVVIFVVFQKYFVGGMSLLGGSSKQ